MKLQETDTKAKAIEKGREIDKKKGREESKKKLQHSGICYEEAESNENVRRVLASELFCKLASFQIRIFMTASFNIIQLIESSTR